MKPNQDDWIDAVRAALRDAEAKPSAGGLSLIHISEPTRQYS